MKQTTHGIKVFEDIDTSMSFREWRDIIAAATNKAENSASNMEVINDLFVEYVELMKTSDGEIKAAVLQEVEKLKDGLSGVAEKTPDGNISIGNGSKITFQNSPNVSLANGMLDVVGVKASDSYKTNNYKISEVTVTGEPHLRISFIGKGKEAK